MNYIFGFEGIRQIDESVHSLPHKLTVIALDDKFIFVGREEYIFSQPEDYEVFSGDIDRIVLEKWRPVLEDALYSLEESPNLIFYSERDYRLFNTMKRRFGIRTGALGYYSLEAMTGLADSEEGRSEFSAIRTELKKEYHAEAEKASAREARRGTVEEKIAGLCVRYGMKAEFRSGSVYVTTYAGEWHFAYNDRPVTLYHSNAIPVKDKHGRIRRHSHIQPVELYSPLRAIHYIRNHEAAEEKRLMGKNNGKTE